MSDRLMDAIWESVADLADLELDTAVYRQNEQKAYFSFLSEKLVGEKQFLELERAVRRAFPGMRLAVRVATPALGDAFLKDPSAHADVLRRFLSRNYPCLRAIMSHIEWLPCAGGVELRLPSPFLSEVYRDNGMPERLEQAIRDVFRVNARVLVTCAPQTVAYGVSSATAHDDNPPPPAPGECVPPLDDDPPPWGDAAADAALASPTVADASPKQAVSRPRAPAAPKPPAAPKSKPIKGRSIADRPVPIRDLTEESGLTVIEGRVLTVEDKELKGGETVLLIFSVTDYSGTIKCKIFLRYRPRFKQDDKKEPPPITDEERAAVHAVVKAIKPQMGVRVRGNCEYDSYSREVNIMARDICAVDLPERMDKESPENTRIELHMHTQMSSMDAVSSPEALIARAAKWGHPAVAITDHGVLQAFPDAFAAARKHNIRLIPGVEGYLCDDSRIVTKPGGRLLDAPIVVLDFETTGLDRQRDRVIEVGAVRLSGGRVVEQFSSMVNPGIVIPPRVVELTGIRDMDVVGAPTADTVIPALMAFIGDQAVAAHNAPFDIGILDAELNRIGQSRPDMPVIDTLVFARKLYPKMKSHKLGAVCKALGVKLKGAHRAVNDAEATAECLTVMLNEARQKNAHELDDLDEIYTGGAIGESFHIVLLAASQDGMTHINQLVSEGHLQYFRRHPHMPRALIQKYREGVIVGSACEAGELFRAVLRGDDDEKLSRIARFYDYLEIQPIGNNAFLVREGTVENDEGLRALNRKIVDLGARLGIPVIATGDVHFLDPEDATLRAILQAGQDYKDADEQPPLFFKTTDEMLEEFQYLGEEKAREVVVQNPRRLMARMQEVRLFPKHPEGKETFSPFWPEAADDIQNTSYAEARARYGDDLPVVVEKRLEKELGSIIGYGYATLYSIARKLVSKSLSDGYIVGSRGSVGSSFVATMCGITEVNPLPPHYRCVHCRQADFSVPEGCTVGPDLPPRDCPKCGQPMLRDGFDIPFEVFLGFKGDKVPDIDLNFSGEYQPVAHAYVKELFGASNVFRAGTIGTLAEKTAFGYVIKYLEERGIVATQAEKNRLAQGLVGIKRTTGQHPAGMVVLPKDYEIYQFTAVQHPADDEGSGIVTTHYDFSSMHDVLVKLDILGHDDPTVLHMLAELTGVDLFNIPLNDPQVMSLFLRPDALGVAAEQLGVETGTLGIPEFGTSFVRQMLKETRPTTMEELIRISGLSHGTDVWVGNAQDIILSGKAVLSQCICTRDDIMNALISWGAPAKISFDTMESVRKGKGLKPEMEEAMHAVDTPQWFIDSCKKIKYMFPKGHAVAYVTMALRVAWFKVHRPLAYYAAYFTVRGDGFDACTMLVEPDSLRARLKELYEADANKTIAAKDKDVIVALELVLEMRLRGYRFLRADLEKSHATRFLIEDAALRVPFTSLSGFGISAAEGLVAARGAPFLSVEDLKLRAHLSSACVELLRAQGSLDDLPETSQTSFFSMI